MQALPQKRENDIVVVDLRDETVVYDQKRDKAYHLNRTAAVVWRHCDGKTTTKELASALHHELKTPADEELVNYALEQLSQAKLLEGPLLSNNGKHHSRREFLQRLAVVGAAILIPTVVSIVSPTAAQATHTATCVASCAGQPDCVHCPTPQCNKFCWQGQCKAQAQTGC